MIPDFSEEEASFRAALAADPGNDEARLNLGNALFYQGRFTEAEPLFDAVARRHPDHPMVLLNYTGLLGMIGRRNEGLTLARKSARHFAQRADLALTHASNLLTLGAFEEAEAFCTRVLARFPAARGLLHDRGTARLYLGKWVAAWRDLENRPDGPHARPMPEGFSSWTGQRTTQPLVIEMEQGLGDGVLFLRYLADVAGRADDVTVIARPALHRLVRKALPSARTITFDDALVGGGLYARSGSLPHLLGQAKPVSAPYLTFTAEDVAEGLGSLKLGAANPVFGVAWSTRSSTTTSALRSLPISSLRPLVAAGITLVALQLTDPAEAAELEEMGIHRLPPGSDLLDVATVTAGLTGVISIDTVHAHIAGAVGTPLILSHGPQLDWRWPPGRENTWYQAVTIFRAAGWPQYAKQFQTIADRL
ncbi:hypothetical protein A6A40_08170 [Azospirillum humicireducens]|uniref:Uncharacterized protein n=1 Tax=Azospirillum humicireducens TaxID=1226968 RepID=A0A168Y6L2_9PROT|nr:tetratricopeptide repeat protein [Azospirillum humicireducens]ANC91887.1 hypothetical protein A6A40_08170 [Azospirillum humicireducens]